MTDKMTIENFDDLETKIIKMTQFDHVEGKEFYNQALGDIMGIIKANRDAIIAGAQRPLRFKLKPHHDGFDMYIINDKGEERYWGCAHKDRLDELKESTLTFFQSLGLPCEFIEETNEQQSDD